MQAIPFLHCAQCFTHPSPFTILFPSSSFSFSLLNNFIIFPLRCFLFPSSTSTSSFILYIFHPQIHRPPNDPTSIPPRPLIDPSSTLHRPLIDPTSTLRRPYTSTHIDPTLNFFNTASWIVKLYTTSTTFLLFSLHHHHHHHRHISIVFRPAPTPPPQYCF